MHRTGFDQAPVEGGRTLRAAGRRGFVGSSAGLASVLVLAAALPNCSSASASGSAPETVARTANALTTEDGLAQAYGIFKTIFTQNGQDQRFVIGFGYHPGISTEKLVTNGNPVNGQATIDFTTGTVSAFLSGPTDGTLFDLYFVKNALGQGTVKPESVDRIFKIGSFVPPNPQTGSNQHTLSVNVGTAPFPQSGVNFDLDMVIVTLKGHSPTANVIASGARTLFEKRFFRERAGTTLDPVSGTLANFIETNDPLVQRGAELFVNEPFGGNGRKCATCHPIANNQTIDPTFVASLPATDPLFVVPTGLEDQTLLPHALIRENVDGTEQPTAKFVERSVPHTLSMSTSIGEVGTGLGQSSNAGTGIDGPPPDQRTGWSGDGAPGRGTLNEFAFGAVNQHYTKSLNRVPGTDFRVPTQEELDALEAFQLFNGRQKNAVTPALTFGDPTAEAGKNSAANEGACVACHADLVGVTNSNLNLDTGVEGLAIPFRTLANMPKDGGFGTNQFNGSPGTIEAGFGNGRFNVPPLTEAADTAPFFHNNAISVIEDAVAFYQSPQFLSSRGATFVVPQLTAQSITNIGGFLRTINALMNIAQVRQRVNYLGNNATAGGTTIMNVAIRDTQDAISDLTVASLSAPATVNALSALRTVKQSLQVSLPFANSQPTVPMTQVAVWLNIAENDLITSNPNKDF
jgi:hypothetical protein